MKKFITKTLLFSLPVWMMAFSMEILLRKIPNDYSYKKEYLDKHAAEIETLILGSSHSFAGINPDFFSGKAFNAAYTSQSINYDYEIFKKYKDDLINLKTLVLPISYFTLYNKLEAGKESWRVKNYVIYYKINTSASIADYSEVFSNKLSVNTKRLYSYYILNKKNISCTKLGAEELFYHSEYAADLITTGKTAAQIHTRSGTSLVRYLNSIIAWCKEKNVKVFLLTPPAFETYYQNLNTKQLNNTIETMNMIVSQNHNCIYINLLTDTSFIAKDFYDAHHLSKTGAEKLSKLINNKINEWE